MSGDDNKHVVAEFVERCQNQHDLAFADEAFHPKFVNHYRPEGQAIPQADRPAGGFQAFYGAAAGVSGCHHGDQRAAR